MPCIICYQSMFKGVDDAGGRPVALECGHAFHQTCTAEWLAHSSRSDCPVCKTAHVGRLLPLFIDVDEDDVLSSGPATPTGPESPASDSDDEPSRKELEDRVTELTSALEAQTLRVQEQETQAATHAAAVAQRDRELSAERARVASLQAGAARSRAHACEQQEELRALSGQLRDIGPVHSAAAEYLKTEIAGLEAVAQSRKARIAELEKLLAGIRSTSNRMSWW
ncbi:hypothetical protein IWQ57_001691 [Coemansia nantahalensis]|uniref:Uncharacterized protein n=1 Tax=Coemansia nantahalensis TaxID=2789366 RepID=A0ACC1K418_9FUNG|nr:hypothetical protein IWQ57_001691 [Coemansia nantahalensis]